jgi:hypothetical protein
MSQISPPIRILLAASLVLMMAWFVFLRPSAETATPTTPAPGSGFGTAVKGAKNATAASNASSAAAVAAAQANGTQAPSTSSSATSAAKTTKPAAAAKPATKTEAELGLPASVAKAVAANKVMVMLFWNKNAIDDRAVRRELRGIDRHKGKVKIHVASIKDVARYAPITRGVNLEQSPTVVVVKGSTADALVGYVDKGTINQTISDVMRSAR